MRSLLIGAALVILAGSVTLLLFTSGGIPGTGGVQGVLLTLDRTELRRERSLTYTIVNRSDKEVSFGEPYDVQVLRGGEWVSVEWMRDKVWIMVLHLLRPGESFSRQVELPDDVEPGRYRLVKEVMIGDSGRRITLTAEFVVVE